MMMDVKQVLKNLLEDEEYGVKVYEDDGETLVPGLVSLAWPGKGVFAENAWIITVGPHIRTSAQVADIGALHKAYVEAISVSVWVLEKRGMNYTAERLRSDLIHEVDRCLLHFINNPGSGLDHVNVTGWAERDEPENGILRSILDVLVGYKKARS